MRYEGRVIVLPIEEYLVGVVAAEMPTSWPMSALASQAVVSRSYAIYMQQQGRVIEASVRDQMWKREAWKQENKSDWMRVKEAVDMTRGWVLTFPSGRIAPGFFHSTCGGQTENALELWNNDPDFKYIVSVKCGKCYESQKFFWRDKIDVRKFVESLPYADEIEHKIIESKIIDRETVGRKNSLNFMDEQIIDKDKKIISAERTSTGRISKIFAKDGEHIRWADYGMIREILPSNLFTFELDGSHMIFYGRGYGHGVGLCQWGAKKLSEEGKNWKDIIYFYFPLLRLRKIY